MSHVLVFLLGLIMFLLGLVIVAGFVLYQLMPLALLALAVFVLYRAREVMPRG